MGNGVTERFNRTLLQMLATLTVEQKKNWKKYVGPMVQAYKSMRQETTGHTQFFNDRETSQIARRHGV